MMTGIADYEFTTQLGEGRHGTCWLARRPARLADVHGVGHNVVVKTLAHNPTDNDFERLSAELQLYSTVESPHLVPLYDVGQQGGVLYYVSQYFADGSLAQPARPSTRASVLSAMADAARAAHALHEAGMAHRGIKPGNILFDESLARLGDIGLSHVLNPGQTITGLDNVGSIEYLAPELIQGQSASRASDVWALGATMHKVLTGRPIYPDVPDGSLLQSLRYLLSERPTLNETLREEERALIEHALAADPVNRPRTAEEFSALVSVMASRLADAEPA